MVSSADEVFEAAELIVKVKEPVPEEYDRFREGQELFTYLHLAADRGLTEFMMERKLDAIASRFLVALAGVVLGTGRRGSEA